MPKKDFPFQIPEWAEAVTQALLRTLRERDPYTYGHCHRVARNAKMLAQAAGLNERDQTIVQHASLFHDLGKLGIPDSILLKPARLTAEEAAIMREHPLKSVEILTPLSKIPFFGSLIPGITHHHERIDGAGYPFGVKGEAIPLAARIILISDTFDAMTTHRPYRQGMSTEIAYRELKQFAGRQFDPHLVKVFLESHPHWGDFEEETTQEFVAANFRRVA